MKLPDSSSTRREDIISLWHHSGPRFEGTRHLQCFGSQENGGHARCHHAAGKFPGMAKDPRVACTRRRGVTRANRVHRGCLWSSTARVDETILAQHVGSSLT